MSARKRSTETGYGMIAGGVVALTAALILIAQAFIVALVNIGLGAGWASALVAIGLASLGVYLINRGEDELPSA